MTVQPEAIALDDGARQVAAGQLDALVESEAHWISRLGGPGTRHALLADNGVGWGIADLALHRWHLLNVPLPGYFTPAQLRHALDDAGVELVLTDEPGRVLGLEARFERVDVSPRSGLIALRRRLDPAAIAALPPGTTKITYTSGSTGTPKGVCLGADALETVARSLAGVTAPLGVRRHLCLLPLATLLDNLAGLLAAPMAGATCVLPPLRETGIRYGGLDVPALLGCITRHAPHSMILVPELLRVLVGAAGQGWQPPASLRFVAVGGASVSASLRGGRTNVIGVLVAGFEPFTLGVLQGISAELTGTGAFTALRTTTLPPRGPGTEPRTSTSPASASTSTTRRLSVVTFPPPMRPAIR